MSGDKYLTFLPENEGGYESSRYHEILLHLHLKRLDNGITGPEASPCP